MRGAHGVLVVFSITDQDSFIDTESWCSALAEELDAEACPQFVLVGSKGDLFAQRAVSTDEALYCAERLDIHEYFEVSARTGEGVEALFAAITEKVFLAHQQQVVREGVDLGSNPRAQGGCRC